MQYIEFFFGNFWHWAGGLIYLMVIFGCPFLWLIAKDEKKSDN